MVGTRLRHNCSVTSPRQAEADPTNFDEVSYEVYAVPDKLRAIWDNTGISDKRDARMPGYGVSPGAKDALADMPPFEGVRLSDLLRH
jgi:hypothetical protein